MNILLKIITLIDFHWKSVSLKFIFKKLFILAVLGLGLCCCIGFSLVMASGGYYPVVVRGLLIAVASLLWSMGSRYRGFSSCGTWAQKLQFLGSRADSTVRLMRLATLWRVGSSQTTDPTCVSCIGKWILYHWAIREALKSHFLMDSCIASHFSYCE